MWVFWAYASGFTEKRAELILSKLYFRKVTLLSYEYQTMQHCLSFFSKYLFLFSGFQVISQFNSHFYLIYLFKKCLPDAFLFSFSASLCYSIYSTLRTSDIDKVDICSFIIRKSIDNFFFSISLHSNFKVETLFSLVLSDLAE